MTARAKGGETSVAFTLFVLASLPQCFLRRTRAVVAAYERRRGKALLCRLLRGAIALIELRLGVKTAASAAPYAVEGYCRCV